MWLGASLGLCPSWAQSPPAGGAPGFLDVEGHSGDTGDSMPSSVSPEGEASRALESAGASVGNPIPGAAFLPALHCCRIFVIVVWGQAVRATWPVRCFSPASTSPTLQAGRPEQGSAPPPPSWASGPHSQGARTEELGAASARCSGLVPTGRDPLPPAPQRCPVLPCEEGNGPDGGEPGGACLRAESISLVREGAQLVAPRGPLRAGRSGV